MDRVKNLSLYYPEYLIDVELVADKIIQTGTGDHCLYIMDTVQKICLPVAVQLRKHIVEKENRRIFYFFFYKIYLRKLKRKSRRPLLSLRTEFPDVKPALCCETYIIAVRSYCCTLHPDIPVPVFSQSIFK